jgi:NTE family protein
MRAGLVLGAGGLIGGAWLAGALEALEAETGWDCVRAERIVGTSAGSVMAALLAGGTPPWRARAASGDTAGRAPSARGSPFGDEAAEARLAEIDRREPTGAAAFQLHRGLPRLGPASPRLALAALRNLDDHTPAALLAGLLPEGVFSLDAVKDLVRRSVPSGWPDHPGLWIVACDYSDGQRAVFGREGAPRADLADAVAASCAIPSFYHPIRVAGARYVDGGLWSTSNLDLLEDERLDLVICLNPTSSLDARLPGHLTERVAARMRNLSGRRLGSEAKQLRAAGADVVLIQPTAEDLDVMPANLMSRRNRREVYDTARRTVAAQLQADGPRQLLDALPRGSAPKEEAAPA